MKTEEDIYKLETKRNLDCIADDLKKLSYNARRVSSTLMHYQIELKELETTVASFSWMAEELFRRVADKMHEPVSDQGEQPK